MTDLETRANALMAQFSPFCESAVITSLTKAHWQFKVRRKAEREPSSLFGDGDAIHYPFDEWCTRQGDIEWTSGGRGQFWIGALSDKTRVTIKVEA